MEVATLAPLGGFFDQDLALVETTARRKRDVRSDQPDQPEELRYKQGGSLIRVHCVWLVSRYLDLLCAGDSSTFG